MSGLLAITLNARLRPLDRGEIFEDPLQEILDVEAPGSQVCGGGTQMAANGEPSCCDIDVELHGDQEAGLRLVVHTLESIGAPKGSTARLGDREPVSFGVAEGIGLYLNGTDLPEEVYATSDVNELISALQSRLADRGRIFSYWQGPTETALYFYGQSAATIRDLIQPVLAEHPLAQNHRLLSITPRG
ncbi:hypothetical protein JQS43_22050 [Natronosporangium hydrolyticum]|uniref:Uncharacterized protein n=1 Tax=Natronosporangium hydrolyticum TaxID=2811111 RepID=A0A895YHZ3_9ACTN|nr:hypothetical protein [Natronosporangium hydrolyticum]QSB14176.1 hypothetical protein JQS43_22050 [Natronosporangium hydrolyticum]